ncbi:MAG: hypothetical protein ACE5HK_01975 [Candidatus Methylomirabilales bacterium]
MRMDIALAAETLAGRFAGDLLGMLRQSVWGRELDRRGWIEDLRVAAQQDITRLVPVWCGRIITCA